MGERDRARDEDRRGVTSVRVDPFDATASLLSGLPSDGPYRAGLEANLNAPAARRDLIDLLTAQATVNVTMASVLLALWQKNDAETTDRIETLLEQVQQNANKVGEVTAKMLIEEDRYLRRPERANGDG